MCLLAWHPAPDRSNSSPIADRGIVILRPQVQARLRAAFQFSTDFILYTESDKQQFFQDKLEAFLRQAAVAPDVGAVLAARSEASFATFPPVQRYTEGVINHLCEHFGGPPGDYSYGPMLLNRALLPLPDTVELMHA